MQTLAIGASDQLCYDYHAPSKDNGVVFVFFNALTGDINQWESGVAPLLRNAGHGTLAYNMRGQANSPFSAGVALDQQLIVDDAIRLIEHVAPPRPVLVGLSIGGLFAANVALAGVDCVGMVLINTLRRDGPRLQWINAAVVRMAEVGGANMIRDLMSPLIMTESWQAENRGNCLVEGEPYEAMDRDSGTYNLLASARSANWDIAYEKLTMPVLNITGLHDRVFRDPADLASLSARIPNVTMQEFDDAGHMVPVESPTRLSESMLQFVT